MWGHALWTPLAHACFLEATDSCMNILRSSGMESTLSVQLPPKRSHADPKINFVWIFSELSTSGSFPHNSVYTCLWQETTTSPVVPTPFAFPAKLHPSKLMGCNHHHSYTATHPTAHSWVFNPQSMGCKKPPARRNAISHVINDSEWELEENPKKFSDLKQEKKSPLFTRGLQGLQR